MKTQSLASWKMVHGSVIKVPLPYVSQINPGLLNRYSGLICTLGRVEDHDLAETIFSKPDWSEFVTKMPDFWVS